MYLKTVGCIWVIYENKRPLASLDTQELKWTWFDKSRKKDVLEYITQLLKNKIKDTNK